MAAKQREIVRWVTKYLRGEGYTDIEMTKTGKSHLCFTFTAGGKSCRTVVAGTPRNHNWRVIFKRDVRAVVREAGERMGPVTVGEAASVVLENCRARMNQKGQEVG